MSDIIIYEFHFPNAKMTNEKVTKEISDLILNKRKDGIRAQQIKEFIKEEYGIELGMSTVYLYYKQSFDETRDYYRQLVQKPYVKIAHKKIQQRRRLETRKYRYLIRQFSTAIENAYSSKQKLTHTELVFVLSSTIRSPPYVNLVNIILEDLPLTRDKSGKYLLDKHALTKQKKI